MTKYGRTTIRSFIGSNVLLCVLSVQVAFALAVVAGLHSLSGSTLQPPAGSSLLCSVAGGLIVVAVWSSIRGIRTHYKERDRNRSVSNLMETVSDTSGEWLWAVDAHENFSFSSRASSALLGYEPAELIGRPVSMVIDEDELAVARQAVADILGDTGSDWTGVPILYRHRTGAPVWMEVSGRSRPSRIGVRPCYEGSSRPLSAESAQLLKRRIRERIHSTVQDGMILTAFQPIYELSTGTITGVEALTRFPSDDGRSPDHWFSEAASVGLGGQLEFAALEAALRRTAKLPEHLYVALNLSPDTCLDPKLPALLKQPGLAADRMVLELTERLPVEDYAPLLSALDPLRQRGLRIAVDDAGSGFSSMRHILRLRPDIIKLDRSLVAGLDSNRAQWALGAAMVDFAQETGAQIVAEGIETLAELAAVTQLGMTSGQGYFLGRPSLHPADWEAWKEARIGGVL
ncbi:sensor domain-containing phosphodiesterase [Arthrobacter sp. PGP41]|uniref:sensor domain-containing phosphodiesterase n=1 Tax=Arthrobacter sp. PGP41 TaxID=2079227 RepID=UPI001F1F26B6|nr:EAL domain-containing protein [Arthrobacter sp. PGP41]